MEYPNREQYLPYLLSTGFILIIALGGIAVWQGNQELLALRNQVAELASTTAHLQGNIAEATTSLGSAIERESKKIGGVQAQVGSITGTVSTLQKLTTIDPELLAKYSKVFFLSENYAPVRLVEIPEEYLYDENKQHQIIPEVLPYLTKMLDAARKDDVEIYVQSAFRSFEEQHAVKSSYSVVYGAGTASTFSADQGYSEHQLGTTVDLITTGTAGKLAGFDKKPAYAWMLKNAHRYGFTLSYPQNNGYYIFEPWHWRFVGVALATKLYQDEQHFYELDQRTIDTYLASLFD